jgi:hypothetical protein
MLKVMSIFFLIIACQTATAQQVDKNTKNYLIYASVYQWYGELDSNENWRKDHPQVVLDFKEYPLNSWEKGAHRILDIAPLADNPASDTLPAGHRVRVTLEFYPATAGADHVTGQYVQQLVTFDHNLQQVLKVETELNEKDDFESRYIASASTNLIRAFLYSWTQGLDEPGSASLSHWLASDAQVTLTEDQIISPLDKQQYHVDFEYQWSALNAQGENEIANIGVSMRLSVIDGKVLMQVYTEQYLAPKTDLGAEVRC